MKTTLRTAIATAVLTLTLAGASTAQTINQSPLLSQDEQACRLQAHYAWERAMDRDRGIPLSNSLVHTRTFFRRIGLDAQSVADFDKITMLIYRAPEMSPERIRHEFETGCITRRLK